MIVPATEYADNANVVSSTNFATVLFTDFLPSFGVKPFNGKSRYPAQNNGFRTGFGIQENARIGQPKPVNNTILRRFYPLKSLSWWRFFRRIKRRFRATEILGH